MAALRILLVVVLLGLVPAGATSAASITVNTTADVVDPSDNLCSLREAVIAVNTGVASGPGAGECAAGSGIDTIVLPAGTYDLSLVGRGEDAAATGDLDIVREGLEVTIQGEGLGETVIDGQRLVNSETSDRVFDVFPGAKLSLAGLRVQNGNPGGEDGGGIRNQGALALSSCAVLGNESGGNGGGIANIGPVAHLEADHAMIGAVGSEGIFNEFGLTDIVGLLMAQREEEVMALLDQIGLGDMASVLVGLLADLASIRAGGMELGNTAGGQGGGLYNAEGASASLSVSVFWSNISTGNGGAICNEKGATTELNVALLELNQAAGQESGGGGIANMLGGIFSASDTTLMTNSAYSSGGGLYNAISSQLLYEDDARATAVLDRVTFNDNSATDGGAIWNNAALNMVNSTVSFNVAANGGGIYHANDMDMAEALLTHVTIADNEAEVGGQIFNAEQLRQVVDGSSINLDKSIVSVEWVPCDTCNAPVGSLGFNLDTANSCGFDQPTDLVNTLSGLNGALGAYGGLTMTRALDYGSVAIDHVTDLVVPNDQRGKQRPFGPASDIGAYEFTPEHRLFAFKYGWNPVLCPGSVQRYTLLLWNSSPLTQTNVLLKDTLPSGVVYLPTEGTENGSYDPQSGTVSWLAPTMSPYQWSMVEVVVQIPEDMEPGTTVANSVQGISDQASSNVWQSTSVISPRDHCPNYEITLADPKDWHDPLCAGWKQRYTLTFTNTGDLPLDSVVISDTFAANATFIAEDSSDGAIYTEGERNVYWFIPEVQPGETVVRYLEIRLWTTHRPGSQVVNAVRVLSPYYITEAHYQTTTIEKAEKCGAYNGALVMEEVTDWHDPICAGWNQRYTLSFRNTSHDAVANVRLVDALPAEGEPLLDMSSSGAVYDAAKRQVSWQISSIAPGGRVTLYLEMKVKSTVPVGTVLKNCAWVTAGNVVVTQQLCAQTVVGECEPPTPTPTPTVTPSPTPVSGLRIFLPLLCRGFDH